jgi:iron-sulfur cluster assembly protein
MAMAITLTDSAARQIRRYLQQHPKGLALRLAVKKTGCSGLTYVLEIAEALGPDDQVFDSRGLQVVVRDDSLPFVAGASIDFVRAELNERFVFENPNAIGECGCGESFNV